MRLFCKVILLVTLLGAAQAGGRPPLPSSDAEELNAPLQQGQVSVEYNEEPEEQKTVEDFDWNHGRGPPHEATKQLPLNYGDRIPQENTERDHEAYGKHAKADTGYSGKKGSHNSKGHWIETSEDQRETGEEHPKRSFEDSKLHGGHDGNLGSNKYRLKTRRKYPKRPKYPNPFEQASKGQTRSNAYGKNDKSSTSEGDEQLLVYRETHKNDKIPEFKNFDTSSEINLKNRDHTFQFNSNKNGEESYVKKEDEKDLSGLVQTQDNSDHRNYKNDNLFQSHLQKADQAESHSSLGNQKTEDAHNRHYGVMNLGHSNLHHASKYDQDHRSKDNYHSGIHSQNYGNNLHRASRLNNNNFSKHNYGYGSGSGLHSANSHIKSSGNSNLHHAALFSEDHLNKHNYGYEKDSGLHSENSQFQSFGNNLQHTSGFSENHLSKHNYGHGSNSGQHFLNSQVRSSENSNLHHRSVFGQEHLNKLNHGYGSNSGLDSSQVQNSGNRHHTTGYGGHNSGYERGSGLHSANSQVQNSGNSHLHHTSGIGQNHLNKHKYGYGSNSGQHSSQVQNSGNSHLHHTSGYGGHNHGYERGSGLRSANSQVQSSGNHHKTGYDKNHLNHRSNSGFQSVNSQVQNLENSNLHSHNKYHTSGFGHEHLNKHNYGNERNSGLHSTISKVHNSGNNLHYTSGLNRHGSRSNSVVNSQAHNSRNRNLHHTSRAHDHLNKHSNSYGGNFGLHSKVHNSDLANSYVTASHTSDLQETRSGGDQYGQNRKHNMQKNTGYDRIAQVDVSKGVDEKNYRPDYHSLNHDKKHSYGSSKRDQVHYNSGAQHKTTGSGVFSPSHSDVFGANKKTLNEYSNNEHHKIIFPSHKANDGYFYNENESGNHDKYKKENAQGIGEITVLGYKTQPAGIKGFSDHHKTLSTPGEQLYAHHTKKSLPVFEENKQKVKSSIKTNNLNHPKQPHLVTHSGKHNTNSENSPFSKTDQIHDHYQAFERSPNTKSHKPNQPKYPRIGAYSGIKGGSDKISRPHFQLSEPRHASGVKGGISKDLMKTIPDFPVQSDVPIIEQKEFPLEKEQTLGHWSKSSSKNAEPHLISQQPQAELSYEALLGEGKYPEKSSGYGSSGFGNPATHNSRNNEYKESKAMPYEFKYEVKDDDGANQYREEKMDEGGMLTGRYGYKDHHGIYRHVEYQAGKEGFKVSNIKTNEPGTSNSDPADVHFEVHSEPIY